MKETEVTDNVEIAYSVAHHGPFGLLSMYCRRLP